MLAKLYEDPKLKLWRANPCDYGAHRRLHIVRAAFGFVASECRCCSGARSLLLAAVAAVLPWVAAGIFVALMAWGVYREFKDPQFNYGPDDSK